MGEVTDKDVHQLWWEFLKQSDDYRLFCQWMQNRREDPQTPVPEKLLNRFGDFDDHPFHQIYSIFNDLHADTYHGRPYGFEVWWERHEKLLKRMEIAQKENTPVIDFGERLAKDLDRLLVRLRQARGREPTARELRDHFVAQYTQSVPPKVYLSVDLTHEELGEVMKKITDILTRERRSPRIKAWEKLFDRKAWPTSVLLMAELQRYLFVLQLWKQGVTMPEIVRRAGTEAQKKSYNEGVVQAVFKEDLAKARCIVSNVEKGTFPGYYGRYSIADVD